MSKQTEEKDELLVDVQHAYSKTELYIEENKKSLAIIAAGIILVVTGYFAWDKLYVAPQEEEAQSKMFVAQQYFENDSLDKAINGDGNNPGFKTIAEEYGVTKSANLAHYYLGICYLKKGKFEDAISELKQFDTDSEVLGPVATGAMGDATLEMGKQDDAVALYLKAAKMNENKFTTPLYLMKAGGVYEDIKNYDNALKVYEQIKSDYVTSTEGREIEKYIARVKALKGN
ncbi:MAG: tetratricopeptide repeat protein [Bacteroidota bacterium]|jgi:TolA-binding protein